MDRIFRIRDGAGARHALGRDGKLYWLDGDVFGEYRAGARVVTPHGPLLPPVMPSKIVAIGPNYRRHAEEIETPPPSEPLMFMKPSTAVIGPEDFIQIPPGIGRVDCESELAIVIGREARRVPSQHARDYILGLTCFNDVTARDLQRRDLQSTRAKAFDTFAPLGPCVAVDLDGSALDIEGWVNRNRRQAANTRDMMFSIATLVEFVSFIMTLNPGDVIATGTPSGVGPVQPGDVVRVQIDGIGELRNPVV